MLKMAGLFSYVTIQPISSLKVNVPQFIAYNTCGKVSANWFSWIIQETYILFRDHFFPWMFILGDNSGDFD